MLFATVCTGPPSIDEASPEPVAVYAPWGEKYDATYVVPAVTWTGVAKTTACQPDAVSFVNVACASRWPDALQRLPTCVPTFSGAL